MKITAEHKRLKAHQNREANWRHWGPYLSERSWGTIREDYSPDGEAWAYFPHDHSRSRVYRWNEDGLAGISDRNQYLCFSIGLWNTKDPILKERLFGLSGIEGNHGEDVKEIYYYLDSTPTHSYMKMLYKYPQGAFPYSELVEENRNRGYSDPEYELMDTGIFDKDRYFDVTVEYAKAHENDILIRISATNRSQEEAELTLLPTLWFRNTWQWGYEQGPMNDTPRLPILQEGDHSNQFANLTADHPSLGTYSFYAEAAEDLIFTNNETNVERIFGTPNPTPYVKDAFHKFIIEGDKQAVNLDKNGTKAAAVYRLSIKPGDTHTINLRLADRKMTTPFQGFSRLFKKRVEESDSFYKAIQNPSLNLEDRALQRQAFAGMLWTKQLYYYDIEQWLNGDPFSPPPETRKSGRNKEWTHLHNFDVISMPDKWEYPWYATWDLAFHCIPFALIDPSFAKRQLTLLTRVWYMHPNGQLPAYEWAFGDVNPPVHAWAAWRVYKIDAKKGKPDRAFLESIFHALLLNFTWWTNKKDKDGNNIFQGGFLGLDNISAFNRSDPLPMEGHLDQADGTAWMAEYCLTMLKIALELAKENRIYQDIATKFFEHFLRIAHSMTNSRYGSSNLWDEADNFFYDSLHIPGSGSSPIRIRSIVGLLPLLAVETFGPEVIESMPIFYRRMCWFVDNRPNLSANMASVYETGVGERHLFSILTKDRLIKVLEKMLDETEFLSPYGIRSLSKHHKDHPYQIQINGEDIKVEYWPGESQSGLFGGNSNWRGPVWLPINYLIIESLQKYHHYYGDDLKVECPTGSGNFMNLQDVSEEISRRLVSLFQMDNRGRRPIYGDNQIFQNDPNWNEYFLFHEYFNGDNGIGLGASHQTGWTGLVAKLLQGLGS